MPELNISKTTTTDLSGSVKDFSVDSKHLDSVNDTDGETYYDYPNSSEYLGYYKSIPELKKAVDALAIWTVGKGFETNSITEENLKIIKGWGEDSIEAIFWNLIVQKKVFGDAFAEIIRDENGKLINLKPLYAGDMRVIVGSDGIIKRYEQRTGTGKGQEIKFKTNQILHLVNDRIGNEIHGVSVIEACKWVINARNEALQDYRTVLHRNVVPVRIIEVDTDDQTKIDSLISQYENVIKNKGEVLVIPKGTVEMKDNTISIQDPLNWIRYLENFFYQAVGIPRVIATSENFTEASSKVGYLTFEPIYTREQTELEADLLKQLGVSLKFNRPPSLSGMLQDSEQKNTGQTGFQPNELKASITRNE